ncbi:MAG TPA: hypothetical protein DCO75_06685, partial [Fibrobacteres bacterium]|nr:hypothetical protein [Fibrobacterota bacterium]
MYFKLYRGSILLVFIITACVWALSQTMGTPLGGIGTGYVIFNAQSGQMAAQTKVMPAASLGSSEFGSYQSSSCGLHFFVNNGGTTASKSKATTTNENAVLPIYSAIFPAVGGVTFADTSFGPIVSGQAWDQLVHSPLAYFDVQANNTNASACTVAVALEFSNQTAGGTNILGGTNTGTSDGTNAITWGGDTTNGYAYMMSGCDNSVATFSSGAIGSFLTTGMLTSGTGNVVAAKCVIPAGGSAHFRFVMSWWDRWVLTPASSTKPGPEDHWYHNYYANAKECATYGMSHFEDVRAGATGIVKRTMGSNFPDWYKERLLNNCYPLIHNSVVAKDGRTGYWEGQYAIIGTIDQAEHAAVWYAFNWPQNQWRELQFWARSSHKASEGDLLGQVHHDFNGTTSTSTWSYDNTDDNHFMYPWDNSTHADYAYQSNTTTWMDLNCMFIFKAYELMLATGNKDSFSVYWPYIKNTANRIITQCESGLHLPTSSLSSYDSPNQQNYVYPSCVSLAAWYAVVEMAKWMKDTATETKYKNWYDSARIDFVSTYATLSSFANEGNDSHPEGDIAGYSWARYFGFPAIMDSQYIVKACNRLYSTYSILSGQARLGLWHFYQYDHMGGALTAIGRPDSALNLHRWDYEFYDSAAPGYVFWQDLWNTNSNYMSYTTAPSAWRSYFQFTGTLLDNANNRLWIRPIIPSSMAKTIKNAPIVNPKGWGTLNYTDSTVTVSTGTRAQYMTVTFDSLTTIKEIVLKNNTTVTNPGIIIKNDGAIISGATSALEGSSLEKNVRITLASPIQVGTGGLYIKVFNGTVPPEESGVINYRSNSKSSSIAITSSQIAKNSIITYSVPVSGMSTLELFQVNGAKIGTIAKKMVNAGVNFFVWNGNTVNGNMVNSNVAVLRLTCSGGSMSRTVFV